MDLSEDILAKARKANDGLLPKKSKSNYEKELKIFLDWKQKNNIKMLNETVFLAYFQELVSCK